MRLRKENRMTVRTGITGYVGQEKKYLIGTYSRLPIAFVKGKGLYLWDSRGRRYLDFTAGLGVAGLGHSHPAVVEAVQRQAARLLHMSNYFYMPGQIKLAEALSRHSFGGKCFFANSGTEAVEGAIKLARKYGRRFLGGDSHEIIAAKRGFHGRTLGSLAASGQPEKQRDFGPLPKGFRHVSLNRLDELKGAFSAKTCAVLLETVQGEGGVYPCERRYLQGVEALCKERGALLILDEVQTGMGRTGHLFSYQNYDVSPDVITLAKGLGNGVPIGAIIATEAVAQAMEAGDHGSTFGGGPLACAAGLATLDALLSDGVLENCVKVGDYFKRELKSLKGKSDLVAEVRGLGLMLGLELKSPLAAGIVEQMLAEGIVINNIGQKTLRFLPPLTVGQADVAEVIEALEKVLGRAAKGD